MHQPCDVMMMVMMAAVRLLLIVAFVASMILGSIQQVNFQLGTCQTELASIRSYEVCTTNLRVRIDE